MVLSLSHIRNYWYREKGSNCFIFYLYKIKLLSVIYRRSRQSWPVGGSPMLQADEYMLPYANVVGSDPSVEDMRIVLFVKGVRPEIPMRWKCDNVSKIKLDRLLLN